MKNSQKAPPDTNRWLPARLVLVTVVLLGCFGAVAWRLHQVQVKEHKLWLARTEAMLRTKRVLPAMRGPIRDRNGELLAHDKVLHQLWVHTHRMRDINDVTARLAILEKRAPKAISREMEPEEIFTRYRQHIARLLACTVENTTEPSQGALAEMERVLTREDRKEFAWLEPMTEDQAANWRTMLEQNRIVAVTMRPFVRRCYPSEDRLTHVLGYVNDRYADPTTGDLISNDALALHPQARRLQVGLEGIEAVFNAELTGSDGYQWIERDRKGRELTAFRGETAQPAHGHDVMLTIDLHLQDALEEVLEEANDYYRPKRIIAVLVEPNSGEVLAMASRPHIRRDAANGVTPNLAVSTPYEPGSVFKVVTYAAAFDAKLAWPNEMLNIDPSLRTFAKLNISDHCQSNVSVMQAFAQSSNRAAYLLAARLGEKRFLKSVRDFGFGAPTGIDLTNESGGVVHKPGTPTWDGLTFSRMAYGHAMTVTPLQMCMAVAAIANGGKLMKPQIVKEIRDEKGDLVRQFEPQVVRRVCSDKTAKLMTQAMVGVVENPKGTGARAAVDEIMVAGKTGTSQLYKSVGRGGVHEGHYCVSFAGFAPADNPSLCAIIVVDDPSESEETVSGGKLAAPIFAQLMDRCLRTMAIAYNGKTVTASDRKGEGQ
ncbi:cell division protein FtsI/penicillin-binding protein 2 [Roseimicrobium gellanilyticum]|uniref:Cell division protein FtsI/penicillin-binding protein 2 n=1 Tax=Roseimicrobium gellanilyticum TaxID=748857 RepID=A0A366HUV5_9BACT|nr:penicillin-binding protein 2 [Roseimicrobium gellanilyticum]RBP48073.1 cell division protein FtsI/penicillin-binding protein 2 [Roseimicrobium gellanilyticum]